MPIVSNVSNEQMNVSKMQIKGVTMVTSHGSPPPGTCHTDLSVENKEDKRTYPKPEPRTFEEPRGGERGKNQQSNSKQATRAKLRGNGLNAHA